MVASRARLVLAVLVAWTFTGCGEAPGGTPILIALQLPVDHDPFQDVVTVRLEASGPPPMTPIVGEAPRSSGDVALPSIPYGPGRVIIVEGLASDRGVIARGQSAPFELTERGPERVTVPFARCPGLYYKDADGDGYGVGTPRRACAPPAGFASRSGDCDDGDPDAHPGQTRFFTQPSRGEHRYDYNCDNIEQLADPDVAPCGGMPCKGEGWSGFIPVCGASGTYGPCEKKVTECAVFSGTTRTQGCR